MARRKTTKKQHDSGDVAGQLEQAFLAGLGALSNTQKAGSKAFDNLVKQGKSYQKKATDTTEALIDDVQDAIRSMTDETQSKTSGLLDQIRQAPQIDKLQSVFDARVAGALDRLGVASKQSIAELNAKLDLVLKAVDSSSRPKAKSRKKVATKKSAAKPAKRRAKKKVAKKRTTK